MEYHRAQVRKFPGFRECTVADAEKLAAWLAGEVCQGERRPERVREELLQRCRQEGIEQPAPGRTSRIIGSGLREAKKALVAKVTGRVPAQVAARMNALIAGAGDDDDAEDEPGEDGRALFARIKDDPGNVSLATVREEVAKLAAIRAIGLPSGVFAGIAPKVVASWRDRAAAEFPSHLREDHPEEIKLMLLAALLYCRGPGDHRHPGGSADRHGAQDQRPRRTAGGRRVRRRPETGAGQGEHLVQGHRGGGGRPGRGRGGHDRWIIVTSCSHRERVVAAIRAGDKFVKNRGYFAARRSCMSSGPNRWFSAGNSPVRGPLTVDTAAASAAR